MKVIVAGSRSATNYEVTVRVINKFPHRISEIVSGDCRGPDKHGERWAKSKQIAVKKFPADWEKFPKVAGFIRNRKMADYGDALIAIWDGYSRGTANMIREMRARNKPVFIHSHEMIPSI